jgi:hypothetical protein
MVWWLGLQQPPWSFGFDSQTRGTTLVRDGQTSPHRPRLVVSRSTCPPLSPSPHANSFIIGTAVINTHTWVSTRNTTSLQTRDILESNGVSPFFATPKSTAALCTTTISTMAPLFLGLPPSSPRTHPQATAFRDGSYLSLFFSVLFVGSVHGLSIWRAVFCVGLCISVLKGWINLLSLPEIWREAMT